MRHQRGGRGEQGSLCGTGMLLAVFCGRNLRQARLHLVSFYCTAVSCAYALWRTAHLQCGTLHLCTLW